MTRTKTAFAALALATLGACGTSTTDRAITGGGIGAGAGAAVGAVTGVGVGEGALIGGAVGVATGAITDSGTVDLGDPVYK